MPTTAIKVPGAVSIISAPNASPGGGWNNSGIGYSGLDTIDNVVLSAAPWNGNNTGWQTGQSDYLLANNFGFGFNITDVLQSITLELVLRYGQTGQSFSFPSETNVNLALGLNLVGLYDGGLIGLTTQIGFSSSTNQGITGIATYIYTPNGNPSIAQINSSNFGILVQAEGISTGVGGTSAYGTNTPQGLRVGIDLMQLTIQTGIGSSTISGGPSGTIAAILANGGYGRHIPALNPLEVYNSGF